MSNFAQQVACAHETNYIHFGSGLTGTTHLTVEGTIPLREYDVSRALMGVDVRVKRALGQDVEDVDFHGSGKDAETGRPHEQDIDQSLLNSQISTLLCLSTSEHSTSSSVTISSLVKYLPLGTTDLDIDAQPLCHEYGDDSRQTSTLPLPTNKRLALSPPITVDHVVPSYQDVPVSSRRIHSSSTSLNNAVANARETSEVSTHQASKTTTTISTATRRKSNILRQLLEQSDLDRLQLQHNIAPPHWKEFTSVRQLCSSHVIGESMEGAVERMRQDVVDDERQRPRKHRRRK
uniref:Uncharacterized protein n=1 Tax=Melanopsichium pennsylvanicum 4 TaxID=1398559 RepID=A0A077RCP6_9BASI|nr:uncharacterized protein BN887_02293 [Melanopsichium pennsylvanicum 4]